ncbi:unnamed protein product [Caenorhabditis bovis]|uniref:Uncharacterized protein n=1 Tax=Caenorhabditis bovis TaxID=2654633 RepID=A0A8S1EL77_9PELO|nr:unnamed protein product [Caenorhabditis bovis]
MIQSRRQAKNKVLTLVSKIEYLDMLYSQIGSVKIETSYQYIQNACNANNVDCPFLSLTEYQDFLLSCPFIFRYVPNIIDPKSTTHSYRRFVQHLGKKLMNDEPVKDSNIVQIIDEFFKDIEDTTEKNCMTFEKDSLYLDFENLETLAANANSLFEYGKNQIRI